MQSLRKADVQPLGLILLHGIDPVARAMQKNAPNAGGNNDRLHVGLAVTREVPNLPCLEPGRVYLWDSTRKASQSTSAALDQSATTLEVVEAAQFGVLLWDLELLIPLYRSEGGSVTHYPSELLDTYGALFPELCPQPQPVAGNIAKLVDTLLEAFRHQNTRYWSSSMSSAQSGPRASKVAWVYSTCLNPAWSSPRTSSTT